MPPKQRPQSLTFLLYAVCWLLKKKDVWAPAPTELDPDPIQTPCETVFAQMKFPPLWHPECPADLLSEWGPYWSELRGLFRTPKPDTKDSDGEDTSDDDEDEFEDEFDNEWTNANLKKEFTYKTKALEVFLARGLKGDWAKCLDDVLINFMDRRDMTVHSVWASDDFAKKRAKKEFPESHTWDEIRGEGLRFLFGAYAYTLVGEHHALNLWWGATLSRFIEREKKAMVRSEVKITKLFAKLEELLGADFLTRADDRGVEFTAQRCVSAINILRQCLGNLAWQILGKVDVITLEKELTSVTSESLQAFDKKLSTQAQRHEHCEPEAVGSIGDIDVNLESFAQAGFNRGVELAKSHPERHRDWQTKVAETDLAQLMDSLGEFVDVWQQREHVALPDQVATLLSGEDPDSLLDMWMAGGEDLGVEIHDKMTTPQLDALLGSADGHFPVFRTWIAKDPNSYVDKNDIERPGITTRFHLHHHQLVGIASILHRVFRPTNFATWPPARNKAELPATAPQAIMENWGSVPGVIVGDTMGMGKTFTVGGTIAATMHLYQVQERHSQTNVDLQTKLPSLLTGTVQFGVAPAIPDAPHIIVVPNSLVGQWEEQLRRAFKPPVKIVVIQSNEKKWKENLAIIDTPKILCIYILSINTLTRMWKQAKDVKTFPVRVDPTRTKATVYAMSYCTGYFDESHDLRTQSNKRDAAFGFLSLCMNKILGTGTPIIEGLPDIWQQLQLIRAAAMTEMMDKRIQIQFATIRKAKSQSVSDRDANLTAFMDATSTEVVAGHENSLIQKSVRAVASAIKTVGVGLMIRRTGDSKGIDGEPIRGALPSLTVAHCIYKPTADEITSAAALEQTGVSLAKVERARKQDAFYTDSRLNISFPPGKARTSLITRENKTPEEHISKLATLGELACKVLMYSPEKLVPKDKKGTQTSILTAESMGLPTASDPDFVPTTLSPGLKTNEKIIVFTVFSVFHNHMKSWLESLGMKVDIVNGSQTSKQRQSIIDAFRNSDKHVLIISNVGATGMDMTFARTMVIFENQWSSVFSQQLYARINRPGQTRDAYVFQFAGQNTIEMLLVMIALRKASTATDYLTLERREALFKAFVNANVEEDGADSEAFLELEAEVAAKKRKRVPEVDNHRKRSVKAPKSARTVDKPKAGAQNGKKRKADHDADVQEPPIKKTSAASKKTLVKSRPEVGQQASEGTLAGPSRTSGP
ncbi:hypothetical protein B0H14DRAFT_2599039 [Mycena olivaceomarginata]|nr:hypothetical protein B0H14DRAFT_2599039 [Mycena olivaceomarginata]